MGSALLRQWLILSLLPRAPHRVDAATLEARLRERGHPIHRRTIQRDLVELAGVFPIVANERSKPYGWRWSEDADLRFAIPIHPGVRRWLRMVDVRVRAPAASARALAERLPMADARVEEVRQAGGATETHVCGAMEDSARTRELLLALGHDIEVLAPVSLRKEIAARARRIAELHRCDE